MYPLFSQINTSARLTPYFLRIHSRIFLTSMHRSSNLSLLCTETPSKIMFELLVSATYHAHHKYLLKKINFIIKFLSSFQRPNTLFSTVLRDTLNECSSQNTSDRASYPYKQQEKLQLHRPRFKFCVELIDDKKILN